MATMIDPAPLTPAPARDPAFAPDLFERLLAIASAALLAAMVAAVARGHDRWAEAGPMVWLHLATIAVALALTPVML
ncbi:hypothetical protein [Sphingomonas profundi]|uniref:hypothetical protein n=1 Tax=Alterirhizorhabdus profundi TaxID=2681549 RepID=UPI001E4E5D63|nr:hypothetical protein [Sphingomonas profundi]